MQCKLYLASSSFIESLECKITYLILYGKATYPLDLSFSVKRLKNCPTSFSAVESLKICCTILSRYPLHLKSYFVSGYTYNTKW